MFVRDLNSAILVIYEDKVLTGQIHCFSAKYGNTNFGLGRLGADVVIIWLTIIIAPDSWNLTLAISISDRV